MTLQTQSLIPLFIHADNFLINCIESLNIVSDSFLEIEQELLI